MEQKYAGFGLRFLAYWVDFLILFPLGLMLQSMLGNNAFAIFSAQSLSDIQKIQSSSNQLLGVVISLAFALAYFLIFWVNYDGATPGKKLLGIKIVRDNGEKLTYPVAFIRYIGFMVSSATIFFFALGFLWIIWDKKKQALHDKIAGTVVVKTDQQPRTVLAVFLALLAILMILGYMGAAMFQGFRLGLQQARQQSGPIKEAALQEKLKQNQQKDQGRILSFAPSSCGLTVPVPKTTDTYQGKTRKWLFEETALTPDSFYVLDKDVFITKQVQGSFIGYKDATARLVEDSTGTINVGFPGLNIYCADNTKNLSLDEFKSLALANKNYKVEVQKEQYWGEVRLVPIILDGVDQSGKAFKDFGYLGVTKDGSKLLYIRLWSVDEKDPNKIEINEDLDVLVRNLRYRNSDGSTTINSNSNVKVEINNNVKGVSTTSDKVKIK